MLYVDGTYFLVMSQKTGWTANANLVWYSTSIDGPWTGPTDIAPDNDDTYGSQNTFELTITGSETTTYIYMGDMWDSTGSAASNYMWLPMKPDTRRVHKSFCIYFLTCLRPLASSCEVKPS
jgi:hypothetical protein